MQKVINVIAVLALALGAFLLLKPPTPYEAPIARTTTTYNVTNGATGFIFAATPYTVTNGQVALDDSQYAYYKPLIDAGVLVVAGATGSNVFVNSTLARIGSGGSLDVQAGSTFTVAAPVLGNPAFAGNVTISGTSALVGVATTTSDLSVGNLLTTTGAAKLNGGLSVDSTAFTVADATGNTVISGSANISGGLSMSGVSFTGPIKYGTASTVISGTGISHGIGTTPTLFMIMPYVLQDTTYTQTLYAYGCNTSTCTVGISSGSVVTFTSVKWVAGY